MIRKSGTRLFDRIMLPDKRERNRGQLEGTALRPRQLNPSHLRLQLLRLGLHRPAKEIGQPAA